MTKRSSAALEPSRLRRVLGFGLMIGLAASWLLAQTLPVRAQQSEFQASMAPLLFEAVRTQNFTGVRSAVKAGADVTFKDETGKTALDLALEKGFFEIAQFLITARQEQRAALASSLPPPSPPAPQAPELLAPQIAATSTAPSSAPTTAADAPKSDDDGRVNQLANTVEKLANVAEKLVQMAETGSSKNIRIEVHRPNEETPAPAPVREVRTRQPALTPSPTPKPAPTQAEVTAENFPLTNGSINTAERSSIIASSPTQNGFLPAPGRKPDQLSESVIAATNAAGSTDSETIQVEIDAAKADQVTEPSDAATPVADLDEAVPTPEEVAAIPAPAAEPTPTEETTRPTVEAEEDTAEVPSVSVTQIFKSIGSFFGGNKDQKPEPADPPVETAAEESPAEDVVASAPSSPPPGVPDLPADAKGDSSSLDKTPVLPLSSVELDRRPATSPPATPVAPVIRSKPTNAAGSRSEKQLAARTPKPEIRGPSTARRGRDAMPLKRLRAPLRNVLLTMGESVTVGQPRLSQGVGEPNACVSKRGRTSFCVVPVDWPSEIESAFAVNTILYQGSRAVARYDRGAASHFHSLYHSEDHDAVVAFLKKRFGSPTDEWKRVIAPFGQPRQPNSTFVWRSRNAKTNVLTILEVRKFDDSRNVFPDTEHGSVRLYIAGGPPVFPAVTALDIMSIDWTARSDHNDTATPPRANTLPIDR